MAAIPDEEWEVNVVREGGEVVEIAFDPLQKPKDDGWEIKFNEKIGRDVVEFDFNKDPSVEGFKEGLQKFKDHNDAKKKTQAPEEIKDEVN
jgi:hypothetical protein